MYRREHAEHLFDVLDEWATDYSVAELMEGAQLRRIPYAMVRPPEAVAGRSSAQRARFFLYLGAVPNWTEPSATLAGRSSSLLRLGASPAVPRFWANTTRRSTEKN